MNTKTWINPKNPEDIRVYISGVHGIGYGDKAYLTKSETDNFGNDWKLNLYLIAPTMKPSIIRDKIENHFDRKSFNEIAGV